MLVKTLQGSKGKVTLTLQQSVDNTGKEIFIFEKNLVDNEKNQQIQVDTWKTLSMFDANNKFKNIVEEYVLRGYKENLVVEKEKFFTKVFKFFK